jgi:hypothetical protein
MTTLDKKGTVRRTYQGDFYGGSDTDFRAVVALSTETPYAVVRYDAFGRARGVHAEGGSVTWTSYHSLSTDVSCPSARPHPLNRIASRPRSPSLRAEVRDGQDDEREAALAGARGAAVGRG